MASRISEEESNYLKVVFVLLRIATPLVRIQFDKEFHPNQLEEELRRAPDKFRSLLSREQKDLLYPKTGVPDSQTFDVTLMILLIKNLTKIKISDILPLQTHTNLGTHLSRIKIYRNMIAHSNHGTISNTDFAECWENITIAVVGLGGDRKECDELKIKIISAYELSFVPDEIKLKNELNEVLDKVIVIVEKVTSNESQDDEDDFCASDDHTRLWSLFTDIGRQVLYHFVEIRLLDIHDETYSLHKFLNKHRNIFHQQCCSCQRQISEDGLSDETNGTKCFPEYFDNINISVENCDLNDLIGFLMKTGKCNEEEKNCFETIMQFIHAEISWDDLEKIKHLAEPVRYKNIVQLQIDTLKMVVEEYKLLYRKRKKDKIGVIQQLIYQNTMDEELDRCTEENEDIQIRYRQLEETVNRMKEENEDIQTRNRKLEETVNRLKKNEELHKKKTAELEDSINRLKMATEENEDIKTRNRDLEESVYRLKENEDLHKKKTEDTMNRLKVANEDNEEIRKRNRELEESVNRLKENEDLHKNHMGELESKMNRLKVVNDMNAALQIKNRELVETTNRLKGENEVLQKKIREHPVDRFNQVAKSQGDYTGSALEYDFLKLLAKVLKNGQGDYPGSALEYDFLKLLAKILKNAEQGKDTELSRFLEKNYGVKEKTDLSFEKVFALDFEDRNKDVSTYTNNFTPAVIDLYNRGFFETTFEDQNDSLHMTTGELLNYKVSKPELKLDLFREINEYEYEEMENSWYSEEGKQNKVLLRNNM